MRLIGYSEFGEADTVLAAHEMPTPRPSAGEVLVELQLSSVNPSDVKARAGARPGVTKPPFPMVAPHSDGAGVITAVGQGVDEARIGQRVWIWNGQWQRAFGTCSTHISLPSEQAVELPEAMSFETGAQMGIPGLTATHAVFGAGGINGKTVLVQGAAGTVGYLATQLAVWGGANVIATARGAGLERAQQAGASAVLDYSSDTLAEDIKDAAKGAVDHIVEVEFGHNVNIAAEVIKENGTMCAYGSALNMNPQIPFYSMMFKAVTLHMVLIYLLPINKRKAAIERLHAAITAGALDVPVQEVFAMDDTAAAHHAVEAGGRSGGVLIQCA